MASIKSTSRSSLIPEMDQHIKRMMKLIDEDADSFTKKVEIYYQKRPELINLVDEVHRMYRSLAERYDHVAGELRKNIPADLQSNCSGITDLGSEPPSAFPSPGPSRRQSGHRAPGFEFFLGNNGVVSPDLFNKGDESPPPVESESESDDSSINYDGAHSNEDESEPKILTLWEEHRLTKEKLRESEQEIARLRQEISCRGSSPNFHDNNLKIAQKELFMSKNKIKEEKGEIAKLHDRMARYRSILADRDLDINLLKAEIADKNAYIDNLKINLNELQRKHDELLDEKDDLNIHIFELGEELNFKDDRIDQMSMHLHQLQVEHIETVAGAEAARRAASELSSKIRELEMEVKDKQAVIDQGAEEKQEAMRQLSFSLEHYRNGYHRLRAVVSGQNTAAAS